MYSSKLWKPKHLKPVQEKTTLGRMKSSEDDPPSAASSQDVLKEDGGHIIEEELPKAGRVMSRVSNRYDHPQRCAILY